MFEDPWCKEVLLILNVPICEFKNQKKPKKTPKKNHAEWWIKVPEHLGSL